MKAREYDPYIARFLQPDPLMEQGDPHPYAYANNNPLKYTDPTGTSYSDPWGGYYSGSSLYNYGSWVPQGPAFCGYSCLQAKYGGSSSYGSSYSSSSWSNWSSSSSNSWGSYNSSSSLGSFGSGGFSQTSFNTSYSSGGYGGYVSPYANIGAGRSTGTPSSAIPFVNAFQYAANGNLGAAIGSAAWDFATIYAPTRLLGMGAEVGRVAKAANVGERLVIGRGADLAKPGALGPGEFALSWPKTGSAQSEWKMNSGLLRQEMNNMRPIRDASKGDTGGMYLNAERYLLEDRGWKEQTYDGLTLWEPPTR